VVPGVRFGNWRAATREEGKAAIVPLESRSDAPATDERLGF
jgi:hypothetical protein